MNVWKQWARAMRGGSLAKPASLAGRWKQGVAASLALVLLAGAIFTPFGGRIDRAYAASAARSTLEVLRAASAPVVDGLLDESAWHVSNGLRVQSGNGDFKNSRFGLLWDYQYLYIGVEVEDDTRVQDGAGYWFEQDNINLFFDPSLHRSAPFKTGDMQLGFVNKPGTDLPEFHFGAALNNHQGLKSGDILRATRQTDKGWSLEVAVPWSMLQTDPVATRNLGFNVGVTDRYGADVSQLRNSYWSAFGSSSFWNDTTGYGELQLSDTVAGMPESGGVLLDENFDAYPDGSLPPGWISDVNTGSPAFSVVQDTYGNGRLFFNGNATGKQARVTAPVQWDHYTLEADVRFEEVLNSGRWASLMFRASPEGKPYSQMAVRQNGAYEMAFRKADNNWHSPTPASGTWQPLALGEEYTLKVRVFGRNVKEYIKPKNGEEFTQLLDRDFPLEVLPERGKIGLQADQAKVSFDRIRVTRLTADQVTLTLPQSVEALSGPLMVTGSVYFSDGMTGALSGSGLKVHSSDESVIRIVDNQPVPLKAGKTVLQVVYANAFASQEVVVTPSQIGAKVQKLQHDRGYALAEAGKGLSLDQLAFQADYTDYTSGSLKGGEMEWQSGDGAVEVKNGMLTARVKGVHAVTVSKDGVSYPFLIVAKETGGQEYVLYEESFDGIADGVLPPGWERIQGTTDANTAVKEGALEIKALASPDNPTRVLLPDYLKVFGDYRIDADITSLAANNASRWSSVMYRVQNGNYPYYQMAVRKDTMAPNGVEFAERTPANGWNVLEKGSHKESMETGKAYLWTVKTKGPRVQQFVDGKLIVDTDAAGSYLTGGIGFQSDGSHIRIDHVKVALQEEALPPLPQDRFVKVTEPETGLVMAPSVVADIGSLEQLSAYAGPWYPASALLHVDGQLQITDASGSKTLGTLDQALALIGNKMMPVFSIQSEEAIQPLAAYLEEQGLEDAFVMSQDGTLVKKVREAYPMARGIVDFRSVTWPDGLKQEDLMDIRRTVNKSSARIALLPSEIASRENTAYLQKRAIVVWAQEKPEAGAPELNAHRLITAGVNGIVSRQPETAASAMKVYVGGPALIRSPYVIGHRGIPSEAPENTIESNRLSVEYGAAYIENDIFVTKDDRLVIIHDSVLESTTNGTGKVEDYTLEEIRKLNANKPYPTGYPDVKVPTLDEQIDLARETGAMIYAELKTSTPRAVDVLVKLIREKGAEDIINVMSFDAAQLRRFAEQMPEMPLGLLAGGFNGEDAPEKYVRQTLKTVQGLNATFNVSYPGIGPKYLEATKHRGIIVSPWTMNSLDEYKRFFFMGAFGLTTDYASWSADWVSELQAEKNTYALKPGEEATTAARAFTYRLSKSQAQGGTVYGATYSTVAPEVVVLDGADVVKASGSKLTALKPGTAHVLLRHTAKVDPEQSYDVYSQPVIITVAGNTGGGENPGNGGEDPGNGGEDPGNGGENPGSGGENPSNGGENPGNTGATPVQLEAVGGNIAVEAVLAAFAERSKVEIKAEEGLRLAAGDLKRLSQVPGRVLELVAKDGIRIELPLSVTAVDELAAKLGTDSYTLRLSASVLGHAEEQSRQQKLVASGVKQLSPLILWTAEGVTVDGRTAASPTGIQGVLTLEQPVNPDRVTLVLMGADGSLRFTPALFKEEGGKSVAIIKPQSSGVYALVQRELSFSDVGGHWAKREMELVAGKLGFGLHGTSGSPGADKQEQFLPEQAVTRAEFAALLARALGLEANASGAPAFSDVAGSDPYAADAAAAAQAGIVQGYEDGTFRPGRTVTRAEMAVMLARALPLAGLKQQASAPIKAVTPFKDAADLPWAADALARAVDAGLLNGVAPDRLAPDSTATRAQAAVMIKRLLALAGYVNP